MGPVLLIVLGVALASAQTKPTVESQAAKPACRTYPTSVTETVAGTAGLTVISYEGRFNPATRQTRLDVRFSAPSQAFTYVQTTTYASLEEWVREITAIPPLNLWLRAENTGTPRMSIQNRFDELGRLVETTTAQGAPADTTTNTEWDRLGRPIAGRIRRPSSAPSTFTYKYDDVARSATYSIDTAGLPTVIRTDFDTNGNPSRRTARTGTGESVTTFRSERFETLCLGKK